MASTSSGFDQNSETGQQLIRELAEASGDAMRRVALASAPDESSTVFAKKMIAAAMRASAIAYCDNITRREEEEKAKITTPAVLSSELQKMVDQMVDISYPESSHTFFTERDNDPTQLRLSPGAK